MSRIYTAIKKFEEEHGIDLVTESIASAGLSRASQFQVKASAATAGTVEMLPGGSDTLFEAKLSSAPFAEFGQEPLRTVKHSAVTLQLDPTSPLFPFGATKARVSEQYRMLRTSILQHPARPRCIAVSSSAPGDGKTLTSINLAGVLSLQVNTRVLLIEADMRQGSAGRTLGLNERPGLADVLAGNCAPEEAILSVTQLPGLFVLPAGIPGQSSVELLSSPRWKDILADLKERFDFCIVDTTPINVVTDFKLVQPLCDAFVLVVRPEHTDRTALKKVLEAEAGNKLLGIVINAYEDWFLWKTQSNSYSYYYGAQTPPKRSFLGFFQPRALKPGAKSRAAK
jgi:protein-tyrosine kinase